MLKSVLWSRQITRKTNYKYLWTFLRRSARCSRLEQIRDNITRETMDIKSYVLDYMKYKQLNRYYHLRRMDEERLPGKSFEWCPLGKRIKGRPRNSRIKEVTVGMREKEFNNMEWVDRESK